MNLAKASLGNVENSAEHAKMDRMEMDGILCSHFS